MNNPIKKILKISIIFYSALAAEYGCMDNSYHLAQLDDPKEYYPVTGADGGPCSCPCSRYCARYRCSLNRGQCPVCRHYRVPRPFVITPGSQESQELRPAKTPMRYTKPSIFKRRSPGTNLPISDNA